MILPFCISGFSQGIGKIDFQVKNSTYVSSSDSLPFWFTSNRLGRVVDQPFLNLTELDVDRRFSYQKRFDYEAGANLVGGLGQDSYFQLNQAYLKLRYTNWVLSFGLFSDQEFFHGLSVSNGNISRSLNARPYPKIRFHTNEFIPLLKSLDWFRFKAEYDEGLLDDERYVSDAHLHHKQLYFRFLISGDWKIDAGVDHFVMWGGTSRNSKYGELPSSFKDYIIYITGATGDEDFPMTDQLNVAGNQYGTYQFNFEKKVNSYTFGLNVSHPFEDFSGVNWRNWRDNMISVYADFGSGKMLSSVLYEFTHTRNMSIKDWNKIIPAGQKIEPDGYYTHGVYCSGNTYRQRAMCSPLFAPVVVSDGIARGFRYCRFASHHIGANGSLSDCLTWKLLLTQTNYLTGYGTYESFFHEWIVSPQFSSMLELGYKNARLPFDVAVSFAFDKGDIYASRAGGMISLSKRW